MKPMSHSIYVNTVSIQPILSILLILLHIQLSKNQTGMKLCNKILLFFFPSLSLVINWFLCAFGVTQPSGSAGTNIAVFLFDAPAAFGRVLRESGPLDRVRLRTRSHLRASLISHRRIAFSSPSGFHRLPGIEKLGRTKENLTKKEVIFNNWTFNRCHACFV